MWPPGHLALAYVVVSLHSRALRGRPPAGRLLPWIVLGALAPDLIDKPLAWWVGVLPGGRTLAHSLFVAAVVAAVAVGLGRRLDTPAGAAVGVAYLSHLLGDAVLPALHGDWATTAFLVWPLVPAPNGGMETSLSVKLSALSPSALGPELAVAAAVGLLWLADGAPGVREPLGRFVGRSTPDRSGEEPSVEPASTDDGSVEQ